MEYYKPNSYKSKEDTDNTEKKITPVVTNAKIKKKTGLQAVAGSIIAEDFSKIKDYIVCDILIPSIKKTIDSVVKSSIDMVLYGEAKSSETKSNTRISYRDYYEKDDRRSISSRRGRPEYDDIILDTRGQAERILEEMENILDKYDVVTVSDFYQLAGLEDEYTDNDYGWTNLSIARVERIRDGYFIKLPRASYIK